MRARSLPAIIEQKLVAFDALADEFIACFSLVEAMHGQARFDGLTVEDAVNYLYACYICKCKDRLLSVPKTIRRYRGEEALALLGSWQAGDTTGVVAFLTERLDSQPFGQITQQLTEAEQQEVPTGVVERLEFGRHLMLNRAFNLLHLLDAIFALTNGVLLREVRSACAALGYHPEQVARALDAFDQPLYSFIRHPALMQRSMTVMNAVGLGTLHRPSELPGLRMWSQNVATEPPGPFAEFPIPAYCELTPPLHNNLAGHRFTNFPETPEALAYSTTVSLEI